MSLIARKTNRAKWVRGEGIAEDEIPAGAVTLDLKTESNTLSFWQFGDGSKDDLCSVVLALGAPRVRPDKMDILWMDRHLLEEAGIELAASPGRTPVQDMVDMHLDAHRLDLRRLEIVARQVNEALRRDQFKRLSKKQVLQELASGVRAGRVPLESLQESVRAAVEKELSKSPRSRPA